MNPRPAIGWEQFLRLVSMVPELEQSWTPPETRTGGPGSNKLVPEPEGP